MSNKKCLRYQCRKVRRDLEDELAKFELKKKGGDIPFNEALEMHLNGLVSHTTFLRTTEIL